MKFDHCEINNGIIKTSSNQFLHLKRINNFHLFNGDHNDGYPDGLYVRVYSQSYSEFLLSSKKEEYKIIQEEIEKIIGFSINEIKIFNKDIYFHNGILYFEYKDKSIIFIVLKNVTKINFHENVYHYIPNNNVSHQALTLAGFNDASLPEVREPVYSYYIKFDNSEYNQHQFQNKEEYNNFVKFMKDILNLTDESIKIDDNLNIELIL
jgi:hypothetical protein